MFSNGNRFVYQFLAPNADRVYNWFMIYEYDDSIHFLKSTLKEKEAINSNYSLRAFAKKLGLSAGGLSLILNRKKKLSVERAYEVAKALELSDEEAEYFMALIQLEAAKSEALRMQFLEKVRTLNPRIGHSLNLKQNILTLEHFKLIANWYGLAVLELLSGPEGFWDAKNVAKKMGLTKVEAEVTIERLLMLELIEENADGSFKRASETVMVHSAVKNEAIKRYYEDVHNESLKSLKLQGPEERVSGAQVFSFDMDQLEEVRNLTNNYLDSLNALAATGEKKTEIYQAITNVFRLSNKEII